MVKVGNTIRELNIAKIGPTEPFKYRLASGRVGTLAVDIKSKGPTTLILVSDYDAETNVFKATAAKTVANRLSASGAVEEARASTPGGERPEEEFEVMSVNNPALLKFSAELSFIGLSIINSDMQEVLYTSFQGARVIYVDRALDSSYDITVGWMQVDNCLPDSVEPIVLYPTQISKEFDEAQPPLLTVLVMHLKDRCTFSGPVRHVGVLTHSLDFYIFDSLRN